APYFQASAVTDLAARDDLAFVTLPSYSPELNPVEECWRQLALLNARLRRGRVNNLRFHSVKERFLRSEDGVTAAGGGRQ
ncbi:transposase, partial [Halorubrum ezzemoulense]